MSEGHLRLRRQLFDIAHLVDLRPLTGAAATPLVVQELPPAQLGDAAIRSAVLLGQADHLEWLGIEVSDGAARSAGALAQRMARAGRLAIVAARDPAAREVALSVSFGDCPVLAIHQDRPSPLGLDCLDRLTGLVPDGPAATAAQVADILDVEAVGRRFFTAFRAALDAMLAALPVRMPRADRHAVALLQLTRVLFLYFVQARGWLDGRPRFLRQEVDRCLARGRSLTSQLLRPLFFGTLNQPADRRSRVARSFGRVPFLNGGLFEPHPLERRWRPTIPDTVWCGVFDDLFERFHFAPVPGTREVIAPDMLGRVFEGVMDPAERSRSGTFYTPEATVQAVVRGALVSWLAGRLGCAEPEADRRLDAPDVPARELLADVTVLDPAVGSGAFLIGMLHQLAAAAPHDTLALRRRILARNLFGVDLNPAAVRLTELRLWLALLEVDRGTDPGRVRPLPNLDAIVRQGDSLFDPVAPAWGGTPGTSEGAVVRALRRELQEATGAQKRALVRALRRAELSALDGILAEAERMTRDKMADLLAQARSLTLFGGRRGLDRGERALLQQLRSRRRFLLRLRRQAQRDGVLPWFHYPSQFAEIFAAGGFDLVVGNPPWVRAESLAPAMRAQLAARYPWWTPRPGRGYAHLPDLSVAFLERARELTAPGGCYAFLLPAKVATADYAATMRGAVAATDTLSVVADLTGDPRARFAATTYPMALVARKERPPASHRIRTRLESRCVAEVSQARLGDGPWLLARDPVAEAVDAMQARHPSVANRLAVQLGVKTGLNRVFLDPAHPIEPELLCWALGGRDVAPFAAVPSRRLLWTHDESGAPLDRLPPLARKYLRLYLPELERRRDYTGGPPWTLFRTTGAVLPHRVVWPDLATRLQAAPLNGPHGDRVIPLNSCYLIGAPDPRAALCLAAWLNATPIRAAAALAADPASSGYRRFNARVVGGLPLPDGVLDDERLHGLARQGRAGQVDQVAIDRVCHQILALAPSHVAALDEVALAGSGHRR